MNKKMSAWLMLGAFVAVSGLSACAGTPDTPEEQKARAEREEPEYLTGSRLPRKNRDTPSGVQVTNGESLSKQTSQAGRSMTPPAPR